MFPSFPLIGWRRLLVLVASFLAVSASGRSDATSRAHDWLHNYASRPAPDHFVPAVFELSRTDYFKMPNRVLIGLGFFSSLFRQHPDYIDDWLRYSRMLPERERRLIISALWISGHPKGEEYLHLYADEVVSPRIAAKLEKVLAPEVDGNSDGPATGGLSALYVRWGEYLATGDEDLLYQVLEGLGSRPDAPARERWWLACTAAQHERALALCEQKAASAPSALRDGMQLVVEARSGLALGG